MFDLWSAEESAEEKRKRGRNREWTKFAASMPKFIGRGACGETPFATVARALDRISPHVEHQKEHADGYLADPSDPGHDLEKVFVNFLNREFGDDEDYWTHVRDRVRLVIDFFIRVDAAAKAVPSSPAAGGNQRSPVLPAAGACGLPPSETRRAQAAPKQ